MCFFFNIAFEYERKYMLPASIPCCCLSLSPLCILHISLIYAFPLVSLTPPSMLLSLACTSFALPIIPSNSSRCSLSLLHIPHTCLLYAFLLVSFTPSSILLSIAYSSFATHVIPSTSFRCCVSSTHPSHTPHICFSSCLSHASIHLIVSRLQFLCCTLSHPLDLHSVPHSA